MVAVLEQLFDRQSTALALGELAAAGVSVERTNAAWQSLAPGDPLAWLPLDALRAIVASGVASELACSRPLRLTVLPLGAGRFALEARAIEPRSQERLELAIAAGGLFVWDIDLEIDTPYWDDGFAALVGYSIEELAKLGRDIYHPADRPIVLAAREDHLAGRTPMISFEARVCTRAGATRWLAVQGRVVDGRRMTGVARDITERKELEQRVAVAERMASIGTLASGIGHEINNPLTFVTASLSLLREELAEMEQAHGTVFGELAELLGDATDGAERIRSIVDRLRSLSSVEADKPVAVDVRSVIEQALQIADHQLRHRARVVRELVPVAPVRGSDGRLLQVFLNLLINAAQSIPSGHVDRNVIRVICRQTPDRVIVEVSDTGSGIAPELLGRIFDPFFTTKHVGEGTGLGLSICRGIVQRMGGEIEVESRPGEGSLFRVSLPVHASMRPRAGVKPRLRLLVIDDEVAIPRIVARSLSAHDVVGHTDPLRALDELRAGARYDGILLDVMMPAMTGIEFHEALASIDRSLQDRVVFMSGGAFTPETSAFLEASPRPKLEKPFTIDDLEAVVARLGG